MKARNSMITAIYVCAALALSAMAEKAPARIPDSPLSPLISAYLTKIKCGGMQQYKNMTVVPLFAYTGDGPAYITMKEALNRNLLEITEISKGGSVPDLKAINKSDTAILMLDGEQLVGAKQNRILNTTILLAPKSEVIIPVSCTEQGRWAYKSKNFSDAGNLMSASMRGMNSYAVNSSLEREQKHTSNQGQIWSGVSRIQRKAEVASETSALQDVYDAKEKNLNEFLRKFPCLPRQKGIIVLINGRVVGMDIVSREAAYTVIHPKLIKSYAMDALLEKSTHYGEIDPTAAQRFLRQLAGCREQRFPAISLGTDYRFTGSGVIGSALVHRESIIHMAFFSSKQQLQPKPVEPMSSYRQRRSFRQEAE
jgi:hypothetical protein